MAHHDDIEGLSHATSKLTLHYYNLLGIKLHFEEAGTAIPPHFLTELARVDAALKDLLARESKLRGDGARPQYQRPPSFTPPPDRRV
jgi:hypothetical protein